MGFEIARPPTVMAEGRTRSFLFDGEEPRRDVIEDIDIAFGFCVGFSKRDDSSDSGIGGGGMGS